ncbi:ionotropic receptor 21a-like [Phlebotomus papatasi]|uniref:ionotropic receptor 21a-like n=1 Tax=Phlebotomus papatasi TaxID=29031 RepID=UPI002483AE69|nr:ionotropic receptor 21a-like [Phlebotomus papatasi]
MDSESLEEKILSITELGCQGFIVATPRVVDFIALKYQVTQKSLQRHRDKYFIFLIDDQSGNTTEEILQHKALEIYPTHLIVRKSSNGEYDLITQKFSSNFENDKEILVDVLQKDGTFLFEKSPDFFPDKLRDLQGKDLRMATLTYLPYMTIDIVEPGEGNADELDQDHQKSVFIDGSEALMMFEFSRLRNFTMKIKRFEPDFWGTLYENGSSDGLLGSVYKKEVDFVVGCVSMWYYNEMDFSFTIAKSAVRLLVPAAQVLPASLTPTLPFTWGVWMGILLVILVNVIVYYFMEYHIQKTLSRSKKSIGSAALTIGAIYLQQSAPGTHQKSSMRILLAVLFLSSVIVGNSYSGGLASVLTVPKYEDSIDTNHEFAESGIKWGAPSDAWLYSLMGTDQPDFKTMVKNFEVKSYDEFRRVSLTRTFALGIERLNSGEYAFEPYIQEDALDNFDMTKEDVYFEWTSPNAVRGWPLMDYFNKHVLEVLQHGLWDFWERRIVEKYFNVKVQIGLHLLSTGYKASPGITKLKVAHISGPIILWAIGLTLATMAFIFELMIALLKQKGLRQ